MTEAQVPQHSGVNEHGGNFSLLALVIVVAKRKKLFITLPVIAGLIAAAVSLALPNVYKASTKLLPPQQAQTATSALLSQLGSVAGLAGVGAGKNPNDMYIGMLKSRTVADKIIARFDLKKAYETSSQERARKLLEESTTIISGKDGLITIEVEDENQKAVAKLTNAYVEELIKLTKVLAVTEASQRRVFFESQLELSKNNLAQAEIALKRSLDKNGVISVDSETRAMVETIGRMRAQISAKEIELGAMRAFVTDTNPNYTRVAEQLGSLRAELSKLENGRPSLLPTEQNSGRVEAGLANIKTLRDVKYYEMLYELLAKQYEVARLDEAKDSSVIQVLDPAVDPERKFKPARFLIVLVSCVVGLLAAIFFAFVSEAKQRSMEEEIGAAQWAELKANLRFRNDVDSTKYAARDQL